MISLYELVYACSHCCYARYTIRYAICTIMMLPNTIYGKTFKEVNLRLECKENFCGSMFVDCASVCALILIFPINKAIDYTGALYSLWKRFMIE